MSVKPLPAGETNAVCPPEHELNERYRMVFEQGSMGMITVGTNGRFLSANKYFCDLIGYTEQELQKLVFKDITHPESVARDMEALRKLLANEISFYKTEKRYVRKNKELVWVRISVSPIRDCDGKIEYLLTTIEDISEEKRIKDALAESEQRYRAIVDNSPDGVIIHRNGKFLYANHQALVILGAEKEEQIIGKSALDFVHPDSRSAVIERIKMMIERPHETLTPLEEKYLRLNDGVVDVEVKAAPIIYRGEPAVLVIARDIRERKKTEKLLRESEQKYRILSEMSPDCIKLFDLTGKLLYMNRSGRIEHGIGEHEDIGAWSFMHTVDSSFRPEVKKAMEDAVRGKTVTLEIKHDPESCAKDSPIGCGARGWCMVTFAPVLDEKGKPEAIFGVSRDVTKMKETIAAQEESERKFRDLVEKSLVGVYLIQDSIFQYINPRLAEIFGYTAGELIGKFGPEKLVTPNDWPLVKENLRKRTAGEIESVHYDFNGQKKDGTIIRVDAYGSKTIYHGHPAVIGTLLDITEARQSAAALRESEERFRTLAEKSPNMIFINAGGKIIFANDRCEEVTGYTKKELHDPSFDFMKLIAPESVKVVKDAWARHQKGEEVDPYEYIVVTKAGAKVQCINATRLMHYGGQDVVMGVVTDISAQKRAERELKEQNSELEKMNKLMVGRELKMVELKQEIAALRKKIDASS